MSTRPMVGNDQMRERGGAEGTRTPDPLIANEVLSQLSYSPVPQGADNAQSVPPKSSRPWIRAGCGPNPRPLASADPWETRRR